MFNYYASDHTFILGCRPRERERGKKKQKPGDLQLKDYKVVAFTLERNHLQWQISKAICRWFPWKAGDPKFLCLTRSDLLHRASGFFPSVLLVYYAVKELTFLSLRVVQSGFKEQLLMPRDMSLTLSPSESSRISPQAQQYWRQMNV